jgi:hypothetical protein
VCKHTLQELRDQAEEHKRKPLTCNRCLSLSFWADLPKKTKAEPNAAKATQIIPQRPSINPTQSQVNGAHSLRQGPVELGIFKS